VMGFASLLIRSLSLIMYVVTVGLSLKFDDFGVKLFIIGTASTLCYTALTEDYPVPSDFASFLIRSLSLIMYVAAVGLSLKFDVFGFKLFIIGTASTLCYTALAADHPVASDFASFLIRSLSLIMYVAAVGLSLKFDVTEVKLFIIATASILCYIGLTEEYPVPSEDDQ